MPTEPEQCNCASKIRKYYKTSITLNAIRYKERSHWGQWRKPQSPINGRLIPDFGNATILKLETDPTPKRPQYWHKKHPRILPIHRHIPLGQEIAEIGESLPSSIQSGKRLANHKIQIGVNLIASFAEGVQA
jgi:hypothetical protein